MGGVYVCVMLLFFHSLIEGLFRFSLFAGWWFCVWLEKERDREGERGCGDGVEG